MGEGKDGEVERGNMAGEGKSEHGMGERREGGRGRQMGVAARAGVGEREGKGEN